MFCSSLRGTHCSGRAHCDTEQLMTEHLWRSGTYCSRICVPHCSVVHVALWYILLWQSSYDTHCPDDTHCPVMTRTALLWHTLPCYDTHCPVILLCHRATVEHRTLSPPTKLLGSGFSTPYTPFCLICTISSELTCISHFHSFEWAGFDIRLFSEDGVDTRLIPRSGSCGLVRIALSLTSQHNNQSQSITHSLYPDVFETTGPTTPSAFHPRLPCPRVYDAFMCVTWRFYTCAMMNSLEILLIHMFDMTQSPVRHMTQSYVWLDSFVCMR